MGLEVSRLTRSIGGLVSGIDLRKPLSTSEFDALYGALLEHHVLFFRKQPLAPEEQVALARRFGAIDIHAFGRHLETHPEVGLLDQTEPRRDGANRWHTDSTFMRRPPKVAILHAVQLPACGGDTSWASMIEAFELLSPALKRCLEGLDAAHDITGPLRRAIAGGHSVGDLASVRAKWPDEIHPVVCRHPDTGRKFLYVNSNFTTYLRGMSEAESDALLAFLFDWVRSPEIQVRFHWEQDSVAIWDNRCTQHYATADYSERRIMHRVTVAGDWIPS
jgi:taurine dioxygenase